MSRVTLVVLAVLAFTALSGCSKAPPSGELSPASFALTVDGNAVVDYVARERPASQLPPAEDTLCPPPGSPSQLPPCVDASSSFKVHFMALPDPAGGTYEVVLANASGILPVGALMMDANNMWELNHTFEGQDHSGSFDRLELRLGDFIFATALATEGTQTFALAEGLSAVTATGTYSGKDLTVTVAGLPATGSYVGRLYTCDPASMLLSVAETFPVTNGETSFTAPMDIADYAEFHVHVGASHVNLVKSNIGEPSGCMPAPAGGAAMSA